MTRCDIATEIAPGMSLSPAMKHSSSSSVMARIVATESWAISTSSKSGISGSGGNSMSAHGLGTGLKLLITAPGEVTASSAAPMRNRSSMSLVSAAPTFAYSDVRALMRSITSRLRSMSFTSRSDASANSRAAAIAFGSMPREAYRSVNAASSSWLARKASACANGFSSHSCSRAASSMRLTAASLAPNGSSAGNSDCSLFACTGSTPPSVRLIASGEADTPAVFSIARRMASLTPSPRSSMSYLL